MDSRAAWKSYLSLLCGTFVTVEAAAFQAPVIPSIARYFGIQISLAALIMLLYFIALTVLAPIMGRLADQVGRKRVVLCGLVLFAVAEFLAAGAESFITLLIARFLQGFGVASILPVVYSYVSYLFPEGKRGAAFGVLTLAMSLGAASGGLFGGLLIDHFGWRSVYWISGILALAGVLPVVVFLPEVRLCATRPRFDYAGAFSLFIVIAALLSTPIWADVFGLYSPLTLVVIASGLLGLTILWRAGQRAEAPVVDVHILRKRAFALPTAIYWLHILTLSGVIYTLAFFLNDRPGGSATQVGFVLMVLYGSCMLVAPVAGRLVDRIEARKIMIAALSLTVFVMVLFAGINVDTSLWVVTLTVALLGATVGANTPAVMKLAVGSIPENRMGAGTGMISMFRDLGTPTGSSFALAVFGSVLAAQKESAIRTRAQAQGVTGDMQEALVEVARNHTGQLASTLESQLRALGVDAQALLSMAASDGLSLALARVGYLLVGVAVVALTLTLFLPRGAHDQHQIPQIGAEGQRPGAKSSRLVDES